MHWKDENLTESHTSLMVWEIHRKQSIIEENSSGSWITFYIKAKTKVETSRLRNLKIMPKNLTEIALSWILSQYSAHLLIPGIVGTCTADTHATIQHEMSTWNLQVFLISHRFIPIRKLSTQPFFFYISNRCPKQPPYMLYWVLASEFIYCIYKQPNPKTRHRSHVHRIHDINTELPDTVNPCNGQTAPCTCTANQSNEHRTAGAANTLNEQKYRPTFTVKTSPMPCTVLYRQHSRYWEYWAGRSSYCKSMHR